MQGNRTIEKRAFGLLTRSILNGVVGDYLEQKNNPLAIDMSLCHELKSIVLNEPLAAQLGSLKLSNKVVVLIHGLTNLETVWDYPTDKAHNSKDRRVNYGTMLRDEFGFTPLFLRYNTGRSIESNGQQLSALLDELFRAYPIPIDELVLVGFSMGGLLARCAQREAADANRSWLKSFAHCVYIGTPHEGSPLEKAGHLISGAVRRVPIDYVSHWSEWIDLRSRGIQDLRLGLKTDRDASVALKNGDFHKGATHYFISGCVGKTKDGLASTLFGDSLVRHTSAVPDSRPAGSRHFHFEQLSHVALANSPKVYAQISAWFAENTKTSVPVYFAPERQQEPHNVCALNASEYNNLNMLGGSAALVWDMSQRALDTTEIMHTGIAKVPFTWLGRIPVVNVISKPVEHTHNVISRSIYRALSFSSRNESE